MEKSQLRSKLLERRDQLQQRLAKIRADRRRSADPLSPDSADQASQRENDEALDFLDTRTRSELAELEAALERVASDRYGRCERCGGVIPAARLERLPATPTCADCASSPDTPPPE